MTRLAIMQGRLVPPEEGRFQSFPRQQWRREFPLAAEAGIDAIEWIYDTPGEGDNPLMSDAGLKELRNLCEQHGVEVASVCADYFMDRPLLSGSSSAQAASAEALESLLERCRVAGITRVVLPFVDQSGIRSKMEADRLVELLQRLLPHAASRRVELHLETDLDPERFSTLLDRLPEVWLKVAYDSGNSAALGYRPDDEFAAYGSRIGSVHVKDRVRDGGTVPLGHGHADLPAVFAGLQRLGYRGDYVLQVARSESCGEVEWTRTNAAFVRELLHDTAEAVAGGRP